MTERNMKRAGFKDLIPHEKLNSGDYSRSLVNSITFIAWGATNDKKSPGFIYFNGFQIGCFIITIRIHNFLINNYNDLSIVLLNQLLLVLQIILEFFL